MCFVVSSFEALRVMCRKDQVWGPSFSNHKCLVWRSQVSKLAFFPPVTIL
jgi:hypothetical protein